MEKGGTMKVCRDCEEIIEEKNIVCAFCLTSVSDKQLPLDKLIKELTEEAKYVVEDYEESPSETSSSVTQVHENSPFLTEKEQRLVSF